MSNRYVEKELQRQFDILKFGIVEITPEDEFKNMLRKSIENNVPLRIKCGIDPTSADIHLGHLVPFKKMRQFQNLGHIGVVIIGDFTACIGDPSGKNESRNALSHDDVKKNADSYMDQVFTVLDRDKTEICYQSEWFEETDLKEVISWASQTTVAKLLSHETFRDRLKDGNTLSMHELFYPILQGIDSVKVRADVELGGTDQKFNVLMGRDYQKSANMRPQVAILLPLIMGTCGTSKMSKSLNNYIAIKDEPFDMFGKVMSIPDDLMSDYLRYLTDIEESDFLIIEEGLKSGVAHPNETKKDLAKRVVSFFHGDKIGEEMRERFENVFKKKKVPDDVPEYKFERGTSILTLLVDAGLILTTSEGRRLIGQNAVGVVDGEKITDFKLSLDDSYAEKVIKVGKRKFLKLV